MNEEGDNIATTQRKPLIIVGIVAASLALVAVAVIVWGLLFSSPTKDDFTTAKSTAEEIKSHEGLAQLRVFQQAVVTEQRTGKTQQTLVEAVRDERQKTIEAVNDRAALADELKESRVQRDDEVKAVFTTYLDKERQYM